MRRTFPRMAGGHGHVEGIVFIPLFTALMQAGASVRKDVTNAIYRNSTPARPGACQIQPYVYLWRVEW